MKDALSSPHQLRATRVIAATAGVLCGISGLEHGFFETLQGATAPGDLMISAIGPAQRFWPGGTETALTIVPNFLVTGILAMLASAAVIVWSAACIHRKHGAAIFLLFSLAQFLVGGGFAQILLVPIIAAGASQINRSPNWFRTLLREGPRHMLAPTWSLLLAGFTLTFSIAIFAAIFGWIPIISQLSGLRNASLTAFLFSLGYCMFGLLPLAFLAGFAHDTTERNLDQPAAAR